MVKKLTCPYCGFKGEPKDFYFMYESVLYTTSTEDVVKENRERPVLVICPRCKQGFFLESPYERFYKAKL